MACVRPKKKNRKRGVAKSLASNRLIIANGNIGIIVTGGNIGIKIIGGNIGVIIAGGAKIITSGNIVIIAICK